MAWLPDPTGRTALRLEENGAWTSWVSDGRLSWQDPRPVRRTLGQGDAAALAFVTDVFLPEAWAAGALDPARARALEGVVGMLRAETTAPAAGVVPAPATSPAPSAAPTAQPGMQPTLQPPTAPMATSTASSSMQPSMQPAVPPGAAASGYVPGTIRMRPVEHPSAAYGPRHDPAVPRTPRPVPAWRRALAASLAAHGLAYLGVLLLFVGVFGLVAFAFGDVSPALRPVAELTAAAVPFVAAWRLRRAGAADVARALVVLGGLLVPLLLVTSLVDGFQVPPDPRGVPLVVTLTLVPLACAIAYAVRSRRVPGSALRHVVVPSLVLAAAMATTSVGRPMPVGQDVAEPSAWQAGAMALALAVVLVVARVRGVRVGPSGPATLVVVTVLAMLTWAAGAPPAWLVLATGAGLVVALLAVRTTLPASLTDVAAPLAWGVTALVAGNVEARLAVPAPLVVVVAAGLLALVEDAGRRGRPTVALGLPVVGLGAAMLAAVPEPSAATGLCAIVTAWALARRAWPFPASPQGVRHLIGVVAGLAPAFGLVMLGVATRPTLALGVAVVALGAGLVPARRSDAARGTSADDGYWRAWWRGGLALLAAAVPAVQLWASVAETATPTDRWVPVAVLVALAVLVCVGPLAPALRVWLAAAFGTWAWFGVVGLTGMPVVVSAGVMALTALVLVVVARPRPVATVGPVLVCVAFAAIAVVRLASEVGGADPDGTLTWALAVVLAAATATSAVVAVRAERRATRTDLPDVVLSDVAVSGGAALDGTVSRSAALDGSAPSAPVSDATAPHGVVLAAAGPMRAATPPTLLDPRAPWLYVVLGVPATLLVTLHAALGSAGVKVPGWTAAVVVGAWALCLAALANLLRPDAAGRIALRGAADVARWTAWLLGVFAVGLSTGTSYGESGTQDWWPAAAADRWVEVATLAVVALVPVVLPARLRPRALVVLAWAALPVLVLRASGAASGWVREHPAEATAVVATAIGASYVLAVAVASPRRAWPTRPAARPPVVVGTTLLGVATLLAVATPAGPSSTGSVTLPSDLVLPAGLGQVLGTSVLAAVAAVLLVMAWRCRSPWHVTAGIVIAWCAGLLALPHLVAGHPWVAILAGLLVALAAEVTYRRTPLARRRHLALLVAAAPIALTALTGRAPEHLALGGLAVLVALVLALRGSRAAADAVALGGVVVAALALDSGLWGATAAAGLLALAATGLALVTRTAARGVVGAAAGLVTWALAVLAAGLTAQAVTELSLVVGAAVATAVGTAWSVVERRRGAASRQPAEPTADSDEARPHSPTQPLPSPSARARAALRPVVRAWWAAAILVAGVGAVTALTGAVTVGWLIVGGGALVVVALGVGVLVWRERILLDAAAVALALTVLAACVAGGAGASVRIIVLSALAATAAVVAAGIAVLGRGSRRPRLPRVLAAHGPRALAVGSLATMLLALAVVVPLVPGQAEGDGGLAGRLAVVLVALAVQLGAWGVARRSLAAQVLSPLAAALAWLVLAPGLSADVAWSAVPLGLALLVDASLLREDRRRRSVPQVETQAVPPTGTAGVPRPAASMRPSAVGRSAAPELALELLGLAFIIGPFVGRTVEQSVAWAAVVLLVGALTVAWGVLTKVRRRLVSGAAIALGAVVLLVGVPLVALVPAWGDAGAWLLVAGVGAVAVVGATVLEKGRSAVSGLWLRLGSDDGGWE